jgi:zinc protease
MLVDFYTVGITEQELTKVKNKTETNIRFNDIGVLNKAMKLAYSCLLGDINLVNTEAENYLQVQKKDIIRVASQLFHENNCSTLYYLAKK